MAKKYSDEQVDRAKNIDLEQFLSRRGETLKRAGSEYKWIYRDSAGTHDSVTVKGNKWFDHKRQQGGDPIGFLQEFMGLSFKESVEELLGGEQANELYVKNNYSVQVPQPPKEFTLPEKAENMRKLYAYLTKTRFINPDVVTHFVKAKSLFQETAHDNIVFLGLDENGVPRAGQKKSANSFGQNYKGTITGSETEYGFGHKGTGNKLFVFEAPIDLLSYLTIYPNSWQEQSYIALDGLSPKAMLHFLKNNSHVDEINICVDYDEAGIEAFDKHRDILITEGYASEKINRILPVYKDWNESLKAEHGIKPIPAQSHPKIEAYQENIIRLGEFYQNTNQNYGQRFAGFYAEKGLIGIVDVLAVEFGKFQQTIDAGKVTKIKDGNANEYLLRMANFCLMSLTEMVCEDGKNGVNKGLAYKSIAKDLFDDYKPYTDKGKLKNHCSDLEQAFEALKRTLLHSKEKELLTGILKNFANNCIRAKVYIETQYTQDLVQQEALLNCSQPISRTAEPEQSESIAMQML